MSLSIADRRQVTTLAAFDPAFRSELERDPGAAIGAVIGRSLPTNGIELVYETSDWCFVVPAVIDAELPEACDPRSAVENDVYALLRDQPETLADVERDPKKFLSEKFGIELGDYGVKICHEAPGANVIIISNPATGEELSDDMLDLVSAGGVAPVKSEGLTYNPRVS